MFSSKPTPKVGIKSVLESLMFLMFISEYLLTIFSEYCVYRTYVQFIYHMSNHYTVFYLIFDRFGI